MKRGMAPKLAAIAIVVLIIAVVIFSENSSNELTGGSVAGQVKCVGAQAALNFINEKRCMRVSSPECDEKGLVGVQC